MKDSENIVVSTQSTQIIKGQGKSWQNPFVFLAVASIIMSMTFAG